MLLSGALAGFVGVNELLGVHQRIVLDFPAGYGFAGIAVSLMGRNHPLGVALAALLFGAWPRLAEGKGIDARGGPRGDQYVRVRIALPDEPDRELERFLEKWKPKNYQPRKKAGLES